MFFYSDPILLAIAILPVLVLGIYVYVQDRFQKEPLGMIIKAFIFGALSILPAILMESFLSGFTPSGAIASGAYTGFVVAGCSEELCKLIMLYLAVWRSRHFDEYFDGIVYAAFVSLGFACFENFSYVFGQEYYSSALVTGSVRAVISVPGHFLFGVTMGYYFALAKFNPNHNMRYFCLAFLIPALLHGTFDALLMIPENMGEGMGIVTSVLFVAFVIFDIRLWKIGSRRLKKMQAYSQQQQSFQESHAFQEDDDSRQNHSNLGGGKNLDDVNWNF